MVARKLWISDKLGLPLDWLTLSTVVYGARGAGKTTLGSVIAEEVHAASQRFCAIDLKGDWWGLKSSADGNSAGIPVVIFGGDHADLPLEPEAGAYIAETIAGLDQSTILDLEHLSKGKQLRFLAAFFETLYDKNREPLLLMLDESQRYAPQKPMSPDANVCLGAVEDIVKLGRKHGIGPMLFTQRGSGLNKEVSELCDMLVAFRTPGSLDQDRIKDWLGANAGKAIAGEIMEKISGLHTGTAVFASNHPQLRDTLPGSAEVVVVRPRRTFDSSATPKVGQRRREPKILAEPELEALKTKMSAAIERAKAEDPKELRKQVATLRAEIARLERRPAETVTEKETVIKYVDRPVVSDEDRQILRNLHTALQEKATETTSAAEKLEGVATRFIAIANRLSEAADPAEPKREPAKVIPIRPPTSAARLERDLERSLARQEPRNGDTPNLGRAERQILAVLVAHGEMTQSRLALQTGYSPKASTIGVALSRLRKAGLVEQGQPIRATPEGAAQANDVETLPLPGPGLVEYWMGKLGKPERSVLSAMVSYHPRDLTFAEIAAITGYSPDASTIGVALSRLRKLELIEGFRVSENLIG